MRSFLMSLAINGLVIGLATGVFGQGDEREVLDDPLFTEQWYLFPPDHRHGTPGGINAVEAWKRIRPCPPVVVAVLDAGVNYRHPDLEENIWRNAREVLNGKDDDQNGYVDDQHGWDFAVNNNNPSSRALGDGFDHGTAVAGLIAAMPDNGIGIAGVGRNVKIMPLRIVGDDANLYSTFPQAMRYAVANGARVVVCTVGFDPFLPVEKEPAIAEPLKAADTAGVLFVVAAGNRGQSVEAHRALNLMKRFSNVLIVGGTNREGELSPRLNFGEPVRIAAPSVDMVFPSFAGYERFKGPGTSFATPIVAAVAATLISQEPELRPAQVIARLRNASATLPPSDMRIDGGRLDMSRVFAPNDPCSDR